MPTRKEGKEKATDASSTTSATRPCTDYLPSSETIGFLKRTTDVN
jgi:hypothetical protein